MALLLPLALAMPSEGWAQIRQDRQPRPVDTMDPDIPEDSTDWFHTAVDGFVGLWLTPDQYGALLLKLGHYEKAAQTFHDPGWRGVAYYYAEYFERAALLFTRQDSATALFNEANARAHQRDYVGALARYDELLTAEPELSSALTNRNLMRQIIEESNRLSESQSNEAGVSGEDIDPEAGAQIADGANELSLEQQTLVQYSAEEILASPELANLWLQNVQPDPSNFLRNKFSAQLQERGVSEP
jgi:Ca-activated chloride channel family protein